MSARCLSPRTNLLRRASTVVTQAGAPRASTSKWTIESDAAYERMIRQKKRNNSIVKSTASRCMHTSASSRKQQRQEVPPVTEDMLLKYAETLPSYVTIKDLVKYGKTPLSEEALIESAEATRTELPHRLARRVLAHRTLPFIVGRNPYIAQVYQLYESSFATLSAVPPIRSLADNDRFTETLDELVADHANNVPVLARGFSECKPYLSEEKIADFFDRAIRNRIGIRLMAEQHLSFTFDSSAEAQKKRKKQQKVKGAAASESSFAGIVDTRCSLTKIVRSCGYHVENLCEGAYGKAPELVINGDTSAIFSYIPTHIEYVLTELMKNAFRATCESHPNTSHSDLPPVIITISKSASSPVITLRVRDSGGGIKPEILPKVHSYAFTTVGPTEQGEEGDVKSSSSSYGIGESTDGPDDGPYTIQNAGGGIGADPELQGMQSTTGHLAGLGFGLPLSKLHCEYFGGSLELVSLYGHGTDAFLVLKGEEAAEQ